MVFLFGENTLEQLPFYKHNLFKKIALVCIVILVLIVVIPIVSVPIGCLPPKIDLRQDNACDLNVYDRQAA